MAPEVENLRILQEKEKEEKAREKLDKEANNTEIQSLANGLSKFIEQSSFSEDVNAYVNAAGVYRKSMFLLLRHSVLSAATETIEGETEGENLRFDKEGIERLLETTGKSIEAAATRLDAFIDRDLLPWVTHLAPAQSRLAKLFMPSLQQLVERIQVHLKNRQELTQAVKSLWFDGAKSYQCTPLGLISNRFKEGKAEQLALARTDALATLWLTSTGKLEGDPATPTLQRQGTANSFSSKANSLGSKQSKAKQGSHRARGGRFEQLKVSAALNNLVHAA